MNTFRAKIAIQEPLRLAKIEVIGNCDHANLTKRLECLDLLLRGGCLEAQAIDLHLERTKEEALKGIANKAEREAALRGWERKIQRYGREAVTALRVNVLRHELGVPSARGLSRMVSGSEQLASFCGLLTGMRVHGSSKSRLDRLGRLFSEADLRQLHATLTSVAGSEELCGDIGMEQALAMDTVLADGTCMEANIHYPADWTLLSDVARTLLLGIARIREHGLLCRMPESAAAMRTAFNNLCIEMTHTRRRKNSKGARKAVLRRMKKLLNRIGDHARSHLERLITEGQSHGFSMGEKMQLQRRMERMLELLPKVIKQAHERIIGGRQVPNADKILSVYEPDVRVLVRGKSGKEVEYGNHCFLAENEAGYIVDWHLYRGIAPGEPQQLRDSIIRQWKLQVDDDLKAVVSDRGLNSKRNSEMLKRNGIFDATCPRDPDKLQQRLDEADFKRLQKRRGSTEARIAILKNSRLGGRIRAKGFTNRSVLLAWSILSHNLWVLTQYSAEVKAREKAA